MTCLDREYCLVKRRDRVRQKPISVASGTRLEAAARSKADVMRSVIEFCLLLPCQVCRSDCSTSVVTTLRHNDKLTSW